MSINTIPDFLAHAIALEADAAERFDDLADNLDTHHGQAEVVALFHKLAGFSRKHLAEVQEKAAGMDLPHYKPWEYQWGEDSPENADPSATHYMMTTWHALQLALQSEQSGHDFYAKVRDETSSDEVKALAQEMVEEEAEHVDILKDWISRTPKPDDAWAEDPDPPVAAG